MLTLFSTIASHLYKLRPLMMVATIVCCVLFVFNVLRITPLENPDLLMPILVGIMWSVLLFSFSGAFRQIPTLKDQKAGRWQRFKLRLKRFFYGVLALATLLTTITVLYLSIRLVRLFFDAS